MKRGIQFLILVTFLFQACEYKPLDVYKLPVIENSISPEIQIVNLNIYEDSIFLYLREFRFNFISSNQEVKAVKFFIDGIEHADVVKENDTFSLINCFPTDGLHDLTIEVFTGSGSGSIADQIGAEGFLFSKSWKMIVDREFYNKTKGISKNGFLKISWSQYKAGDFKEYIITRSAGWLESVEIGRVQSLNFVDSTYVGEESIYYISVNTTDNQIYSWGRLELDRDFPRFKLKTTEDNQYIIQWDKSKYYNAVDTFILSSIVGYGSAYTPIFSTQNSNDSTLHLVDACFGDDIDFKLHLVPKKTNICYTPEEQYMFDVKKRIYLGVPIYCTSHMTDICQVSQDEFVFESGCDTLIKYSTSSKSIIKKMGYTANQCYSCSFSRTKSSPSGKYITSYYACKDDVMLIKSKDLDYYYVRNLNHLTGINYVPSIPVSDNGIGIVNSHLTGFYLYNFISHTILADYNKNVNSAFGEKISPNGDYIFLMDDSLRLVKYENNKFINIWGVRTYNGPEFYEFHSLNNNLLITWDGSTFSINQCSDFSVINNFALTDKKLLNVDYYNDEILTYNDGHLLVRSLLNGDLLKDIPVNSPDLYYTCTLVNHTIVSDRGVLYFIN